MLKNIYLDTLKAVSAANIYTSNSGSQWNMARSMFTSPEINNVAYLLNSWFLFNEFHLKERNTRKLRLCNLSLICGPINKLAYHISIAYLSHLSFALLLSVSQVIRHFMMLLTIYLACWKCFRLQSFLVFHFFFSTCHGWGAAVNDLSQKKKKNANSLQFHFDALHFVNS